MAIVNERLLCGVLWDEPGAILTDTDPPEIQIFTIGFDFVALRILYIGIRTQVEPPVQYKANCVENSESIQGIFRSGRTDLFTKYCGDEKSAIGGHSRRPP